MFFRAKIFKIIKNLREDNDGEIINGLKDVLGGLISDKELLKNKDTICIELQELLKNNFSKSLQILSAKSVDNIGEDIRLGTIHSVKGETHKATLLMLDSEFTTGYGKTSPSYSMLQLLVNYLRNNYVELPEDKNDMEKETEKALKLAYVALSRPTHLVCIGIQESQVGDCELLKSLQEAGWEQYLDAT